MEICIVYLSSSSGLYSKEEISAIVDHSQAKNRALDITGILLYCNGSIIQVLEGPQQEVEALYNVISLDERHTQVMRLYSGEIKKRTFPDWLMGYKTLSEREMDHLKYMMPFTKDPNVKPRDPNNIILELVQTFFKNNHRN